MILVGGYNKYNQLVESNDTENKKEIITHKTIDIDKNIRSFSSYANHSVKIDENGHAFGIGSDELFQLGTPNRQVYHEFTQIIFNEDDKFISAYCGSKFTLYITEINHLILCSELDPLKIPRRFELDTKPASLYGGKSICAIIDNRGDVYIINPSTIYAELDMNKEKREINHLYPTVHLPNKAVMVACGNKKIFTLTDNNRLYSNTLEKSGKIREYRKVTFKNIIDDVKINFICGTCDTFIALDTNGKTYRYCSSSHLVKPDEIRKQFVLIDSLEDYNVTSAFVGVKHCLFITADGCVLSCGSNKSKQLLLKDVRKSNVAAPSKVDIGEGNSAKFAIAGKHMSLVFLNAVPKHCPNMAGSLAPSAEPKRPLSRKPSSTRLKYTFEKCVKPVNNDASEEAAPPKAESSEPAALDVVSHDHATHEGASEEADPPKAESSEPAALDVVSHEAATHEGASEEADPPKPASPAKASPPNPVDIFSTPISPGKFSKSVSDAMSTSTSSLPDDDFKSAHHAEEEDDDEDDEVETPEGVKEEPEVTRNYEEEIDRLKKQNALLIRLIRKKKDDGSDEKFIDPDEFKSLEFDKTLSSSPETEVTVVKKMTTVTSLYTKKSFKTTDYKEFRKFVRHFNIQSSIKHPCIVEFYRFANSTEVSYPSLLVKYYPYNLHQLMELHNDDLTNTDKVEMIVDIVFGMKFLHECQSIVHRNLKPENILVSKHYHAKIGDLSKADEIEPDIKYSKSNGGFSVYTAPEINNGENYHEKVDQYAFGKLMYFIVNGVEEEFDMTEINKGVTYKRSDKFTPLANDIMEKCCAYSPEDRPLFSEIFEWIVEGKFNLLPNVEVEHVKGRILKLKLLEEIDNPPVF